MKLFKKDKLENMKEDILEEQSKPVKNELLDAKLTALDEARKATSDRFLTVAEQIGDLRSQNRALEGSIRDLSMKATKTVDLVSSVQPETMHTRIQQQDAAIKALSARVEQVKGFHEEVMKELKTIRTQMGMFRGIEQTIKMNKEAQETLVSVEKISHQVKGYADKVADEFATVKKDYERIGKTEELAKSTRKDVDKIMQTFDTINTKAQNLLTRDDIDAVKKESDRMEEELMQALNECKKEIADCYGAIDTRHGLEKTASQIERTAAQVQIESKAHQKTIAQLLGRIDKLEKQVRDQAKQLSQQAKILKKVKK